MQEPIAVVGIGCRFPGGIYSAHALWEALLNKVDAVSDIPHTRWNAEFLYDKDISRGGKINSRRGGFLDNIKQFDAEFFNFYPAEAKQLDPQQRLLLETSYEAFEDAGETLERLRGSHTGVFIGTFVYDYHTLGMSGENLDNINMYSAMGSGMASIASRLSYTFDLKGPCMMLDTYCSSSMVALHLACRSIWDGDADAAIAGGVNAILKPDFSIALAKAGFLSDDGACKAFDASGNGYVRSEGVGVVYLKPLAKALADDDLIYTVIRGSAINQDGYVAEGMTVPDYAAQVDMLQRAYQNADVKPADVHYVEAHGPGTVLGDPIETHALGTVLGQERSDDQALWVGSIKSNLGHLEGASGIAGFIKAALVNYHGIAPPNLHFNTPNPRIDFDTLKLAIPTQATRLADDDERLFTGVNSFGAGGTNVHVVLARHRSAKTKDTKSTLKLTPTRHKPLLPHLLTLSARTPKALNALAQRYVAWLEDDSLPLEQIAWSQFKRRSRHPYHVFISTESRADLRQQLQAISEDKKPLASAFYHNPSHAKPKLAFVYSGQGGQWAQMGLALMEKEPVFRQCLETIDALFSERTGWSLLAEIQHEADGSRLNETTIVQPTTMAIQIALTTLYAHYGVKPAGIVGHSIGEVAAAWAAGAISLETAVSIIYHRSQIQNQASGKGTMLAAAVSREQAEQLLLGIDDEVCIATINAPTLLTFSGKNQHLQDIAQQLEQQEVFHRFVNVKVPYHSHAMEPLQEDLLAALADSQGHDCHTPLYSTVSAQRESGRHLTAEYWYQNIRQAVLFSDTLATMLDEGYNAFIEIGPHPVLLNGIEESIRLKKKDALVAAAMNRKIPTSQPFWLAMGAYLAQGGEVNWQRVLNNPNPQFIKLPPYPWQHKDYWLFSEQLDGNKTVISHHAFAHPFLQQKKQILAQGKQTLWQTRLESKTQPYLGDHVVDGTMVLPATAHLELVNAVAKHLWLDQHRQEDGTIADVPEVIISLRQVYFHTAMVLPDKPDIPFQSRLELNHSDQHFSIASRYYTEGSEPAWQPHSSGHIVFQNANTTSHALPCPRIAKNLADIKTYFADCEMADIDKFYRTRRQAGLQYGALFQCIQQLQLKGQHVLAQLALDDSLIHDAQFTAVHPTLADAAIHATFVYIHATEEPQRHYLPASIKRLQWYAKADTRVWAYAEITYFNEQKISGDGFLYNEDGRLVAHFEQLSCHYVPKAQQHDDPRYQHVYETPWQMLQTASASEHYQHHVQHFVLIGHDARINAPLKTALRTKQSDIHLVELPLTEKLVWPAQLPLDNRCHIIYLAPQHLEPTASLNGANLEAHFLAAIAPLLSLLQTITQVANPPRLTLLSCGAQRVQHADYQDKKCAVGLQSGLQKLLQVAHNEYHHLACRSVDLSLEPQLEEIQQCCDELFFSSMLHDETQVALRAGRRYSQQLKALVAELVEADYSQTIDTANSPQAWRSKYQPTAPIPFTYYQEQNLVLAADHVCVHIEATSFHIKALQEAHAQQSRDVKAKHIDYAFVGRVQAVGNAVNRVSLGEKVWGISHCAAYANPISIPQDSLSRFSLALEATEAAALFIPYASALYLLQQRLSLRAGSRLLLQGLPHKLNVALLQVAETLALQVYLILAETDTPEDYPEAALIDREAYSTWQVLEQQQFDAIISADNTQIHLHLGHLKPFAHYISLSAFDQYIGHYLNKENAQNLSINTVNLSQVFRTPALHPPLLSHVNVFFQQHTPRIHVNTVTIGELAERFPADQADAHSVVGVAMQQGHLRLKAARHLALHSEKTYLISGGTRGFGLQLALWLSQRGAKHLVLISRSGCQHTEDQAQLDKLRQKGVQVDVHALDIADEKALQSLFQALQTRGCLLGGVIHAAGVMRDGGLANMNVEDFRYTLRPKAIGAWNLHRACCQIAQQQAQDNEAKTEKHETLDFFVLLSSISSALNMEGTSNYSLSNAFLDALAQYRHSQGLVATSLNLGILGNYAGLSQATGDNQHMLDRLELMGLQRFMLAEVLSKIEMAMIQQVPQRLLVKIDWQRYAQSQAHMQKEIFYQRVFNVENSTEIGHSPQGNVYDQLMTLAQNEAVPYLAETLSRGLANLLDIEADEISVDEGLSRFAMDSIMMVRFSTWIQHETSIDLPLMRLLHNPSLIDISEYVIERLHDTQEGDDDSSAQQALLLFMDKQRIAAQGRWILRSRGRSDAPVRLICFHSLGAGASLFHHFLMQPLDNVEVIALQTPGRENRSHETVIEDFDELSTQLYRQVETLMDKPTIFLGHSFGGIVAYTIIRRLQAAQQPLPVHLITAGTAAPNYFANWKQREAFVRLAAEDNSPEYITSLFQHIEDSQLVAKLVSLMQRDIALLQSYHYQSQEPLSLGISALAARQDEMVYRHEIEPWQQHTTADFKLYDVEGDHWFLLRQHEPLEQVVAECVARILG